MEREHTSRQYEEKLRNLKDKLLLMSTKAEQAISDSVRALVERKPSLALEIIDNDMELDRFEIEIDDLCYEILAREQPVARDLRFVATALKIVRDIERIGDNAVNVARRASELIEEPELKPLIDVPIMSNAALKILRDSLDAFVNEDTDLAEKVIADDTYIDDVYEQILRELLTYMMENPRTISRALKLIFVARSLARVGDHSKNIAEMVIFLVRGEDIRHTDLAK